MNKLQDIERLHRTIEFLQEHDIIMIVFDKEIIYEDYLDYARLSLRYL